MFVCALMHINACGCKTKCVYNMPPYEFRHGSASFTNVKVPPVDPFSKSSNLQSFA